MEILKDEADLVQPEIGECVVAESPDVGALERHVAAVGAQDSRDDAEHGRLAAARRSDYVEDLAEVGLEAHVLHCMSPGIAFAEPFVEGGGLDCGFRHG